MKENTLSGDEKPVVTFAEKEVIERKYRKALFDDLMNGRTMFSAGPYEAHIQYSNFCNMSCIMCWNGNNPPTRKTDANLLERIGEQLGPHLSVVTPYSGSEPLVLTWEETRQMALKYGILLCVTTNVQFLDEEKFHELKDITETLILSIDSHIPEVFEKIRPRGNSKKVFANLATTAKLSVEHNLECIVNIVLLTQNAPMLTDTLNYLADLGIQNVNIIQLLDVNGDSRMYDPLLHYSAEYISWLKQSSIATAKQRKFRLIWSVSGYAEYDYRAKGHIEPKARKDWNDDWDEKMKLFFPRFCRNAYGRLRIDSEGDVSPCCYATQGELSLGNLQTQNFDEIWNSTEAQDLRRGMYSGDVPALCQSCRYHDLVKPFSSLPFIESEASLVPELKEFRQPSLPTMEILEPAHGSRVTDCLKFRIQKPNAKIAKYVVALSLGGQEEEIHQEVLVPTADSEGVLSFQMPDRIFDTMRTNVGYWWMIWAVPANRNQNAIRCEEVRCVIRHQELVRLEGSSLRYRDQGFIPVSDLGGNKQSGWQDPSQLPARPIAAFHGRGREDGLSPKPVRGRIKSDSVSGNSKEPSLLNGLVRRWFPDEIKSGIKNAYLDGVQQHATSIQISGWIMLNDGAADSIEIISLEGERIFATAKERPDIALGYPKIESAGMAGFEATLTDELYWNKDRYQFSIVAMCNGKVEFRCHVRCRGGYPNGSAGDEEEINQTHCIRNGVLEI